MTNIFLVKTVSYFLVLYRGREIKTNKERERKRDSKTSDSTDAEKGVK